MVICRCVIYTVLVGMGKGGGGVETQVDRGTLCCVHTMCGRGAEMPFLATYM